MQLYTTAITLMLLGSVVAASNIDIWQRLVTMKNKYLKFVIRNFMSFYKVGFYSHGKLYL